MNKLAIVILLGIILLSAGKEKKATNITTPIAEEVNKTAEAISLQIQTEGNGSQIGTPTNDKQIDGNKEEKQSNVDSIPSIPPLAKNSEQFNGTSIKNQAKSTQSSNPPLTTEPNSTTPNLLKVVKDQMGQDQDQVEQEQNPSSQDSGSQKQTIEQQIAAFKGEKNETIQSDPANDTDSQIAEENQTNQATKGSDKKQNQALPKIDQQQDKSQQTEQNEQNSTDNPDENIPKTVLPSPLNEKEQNSSIDASTETNKSKLETVVLEDEKNETKSSNLDQNETKKLKKQEAKNISKSQESRNASQKKQQIKQQIEKSEQNSTEQTYLPQDLLKNQTKMSKVSQKPILSKQIQQQENKNAQPSVQNNTAKLINKEQTTPLVNTSISTDDQEENNMTLRKDESSQYKASKLLTKPEVNEDSLANQTANSTSSNLESNKSDEQTILQNKTENTIVEALPEKEQSLSQNETANNSTSQLTSEQNNIAAIPIKTSLQQINSNQIEPKQLNNTIEPKQQNKPKVAELSKDASESNSTAPQTDNYTESSAPLISNLTEKEEITAPPASTSSGQSSVPKDDKKQQRKSQEGNNPETSIPQIEKNVTYPNMHQPPLKAEQTTKQIIKTISQTVPAEEKGTKVDQAQEKKSEGELPKATTPQDVDSTHLPQLKPKKPVNILSNAQQTPVKEEKISSKPPLPSSSTPEKSNHLASHPIDERVESVSADSENTQQQSILDKLGGDWSLLIGGIIIAFLIFSMLLYKKCKKQNGNGFRSMQDEAEQYTGSPI